MFGISFFVLLAIFLFIEHKNSRSRKLIVALLRKHSTIISSCMASVVEIYTRIVFMWLFFVCFILFYFTVFFGEYLRVPGFRLVFAIYAICLRFIFGQMFFNTFAQTQYFQHYLFHALANPTALMMMKILWTGLGKNKTENERARTNGCCRWVICMNFLRLCTEATWTSKTQWTASQRKAIQNGNFKETIMAEWCQVNWLAQVILKMPWKHRKKQPKQHKRVESRLKMFSVFCLVEQCLFIQSTAAWLFKWHLNLPRKRTLYETPRMLAMRLRSELNFGLVFIKIWQLHEGHISICINPRTYQSILRRSARSAPLSFQLTVLLCRALCNALKMRAKFVN